MTYDEEPHTSSSSKYLKVLGLRQEVLRKPLNMNLFDEDLSSEKDQLIFVANFEDRVVGCCMLKSVS